MGEYHRAYYQANKEKIKARSMERYYSNRDESIKRTTEYNKANAEKRKVWCEKWRKNNLDRCASKEQRRRARKAMAEQGPALTLNELIEFYGNFCMAPECKQMELTVDHVIPLALGGAHAAWNQQILCKSHNSSKGARKKSDYRPFVVVSLP